MSLVAFVLCAVLVQDPASRPALEAKETELLDGTLFVRLPVYVPAPAYAPNGAPANATALMEVQGKGLTLLPGRPDSSILSRSIDGRGFAVRAVQMPWRASAAFGADVHAEVTRWEKLDEHRRRFTIEPLKLASAGEAFVVVPSAIVDEGKSGASTVLTTPRVTATNLVVFLVRTDRLVQQVAFYQAADARDQTALSREVAATLRTRAEPIDTSARRVELPNGAVLDVPDGWLSSSCSALLCGRQLLLQKVVSREGAAPSLAVRTDWGPQCGCTLRTMFEATAGHTLATLWWQPDLPGWVATAGSMVLACWGAEEGLRAIATHPVADVPLAGGAVATPLVRTRTWFSEIPTQKLPGTAGIWAGAPDEASWAEVDDLMKRAQAALGARPK